jgi:hypothetical protein
MPAIVEVIAEETDQAALVDLIMELAKHLGVTEDQFAKIAAKVRENTVDRGGSFSAKVSADRSQENRASVAGNGQRSSTGNTGVNEMADILAHRPGLGLFSPGLRLTIGAATMICENVEETPNKRQSKNNRGSLCRSD